jgi:tRNA1Val (adenine37-N6)-methyltransferase
VSSVFKFKKFTILQEKSALKVGTDSMLLGSLIDPSHATRGLDLGTGTGVLALMITQKAKGISVDAIDSDYDSYLECCTNFKNSPWSNRLNAHLGNYFDYFTTETYDLIFANPPFYIELERNTKSLNIQTKHTNQNELSHLISLVSRHLSAQGVFWIVVPYSLHKYILEESKLNKLYINNIIVINSKSNKRNTRVIMSFSFIEISPVHREFTIRNQDNSYTKEYISLTRDFHFKALNN